MDVVLWNRRLREQADLEASHAEVADVPSFRGRTCLGRVLLLRMRIEESLAALAKATGLMQREADVGPDEALIHHGTCREARILSGERRPLAAPTPYLEHADGFLGRILEYHRGLDGAQLLSVGDSDGAAAVFGELLSVSTEDYSRAFWHLGLAVCLMNLGRRDVAASELEAAGLHLSSVEYLLGRARLAPRLATVYSLLGRHEEAEGWRVFFSRLPCPPGTKRDLLRRADLLLERFTESGVLTCV